MPPLTGVLLALARANPALDIILSHQRRSQRTDDALFAGLARKGFAWTVVPKDGPGGLHPDFTSELISVYRITWMGEEAAAAAAAAEEQGREEEGQDEEGGQEGEETCAAAVCTAAKADTARDNMIDDIVGGGVAPAVGDASAKWVLARGCDPVMAQRARQMLPPLIGDANLVSCTDDDEFFRLLAGRQYDAVFFAPGACRYSAAKQPIPGGNDATKGWTLDDYKQRVREVQGDAVVIVETTREPEIVPLMRRALGLD